MIAGAVIAGAMSSGGDGLVVTGGRGYAVRLDSLETAAGELRDAAVAVANAGRTLYVSRLAVEGGACSGSALAVRYGDESLRIEGTARRIASEAEGVAASVRTAASAYEEEEARRAAAVDGLQNFLAGSEIVPLLLRQFGLGAFADLMRRSNQGPGKTLAGMAREAANGGIEDSREGALSVDRARVAAGSGDPGTFAYSLRSLRTAQTQVPLDDGTSVPESSILVERFERADGTLAVLVTVPGTQTWGLDDANLMDTEGILDGMAARDSQIRALIRQALAEQELGQDDEVVFTAYSQGVIHVMGLLEDEEFLARYRVSAVTAVGGPVTAFKPPAGIPVLSLTNADDIVPAAAGRIGEPSSSVVMVRTPPRGGAAERVAFPQETLAQAHDLGNYERDAALLDGSSNPSIAAHAAIVGAALGGASLGGPPPQRERLAYTGTDTKAKTGRARPGS
ncbi:hypothetical protein [Sinomonas sp. P47F7]|uniref:hypothetical protein n=1 Tax=Sinomonas sp. P47F7 TaxID=3410987 RepID=UPI003BF5549E